MSYLEKRPVRMANQPRMKAGERCKRDKIGFDPGLRTVAMKEAAALGMKLPLFVASAVALVADQASRKRRLGLVEWPDLTDEGTLARLEEMAAARGHSANQFLHWLIDDHFTKYRRGDAG